jgi:hypothetical protein
MYDDLLSSEARERISRIQLEAAHYRNMIDEAPLYFHARNPIGDVRRLLATGVHRLAAVLSRS